MTKLILSLRQNAESFLAEAISKAAIAEQKDPYAWKFAIFSLVQSIELTLKERLQKEHPLLVYADIDNPKLSVSLDKALSRLTNINPENLTADDIRNIRIAAAIRNSIAHHAVDVSIEQLRVVFANLFAFLVDFSRRQLNIEVSHALPAQLWSQAIAVENYGAVLYKRAVQHLKDDNIDNRHLISCIKCWHDTYANTPKIGRCYLCGFSERTTVCQECGLGLFASQAYRVPYGRWKNYGAQQAEEWQPELCEDCHIDFVANGPRPFREPKT